MAKKNRNLEARKKGELAVCDMSAHAQDYYYNTDPIGVWEYRDLNGNKVYDIFYGVIEQGLTFEDVEKKFEALYEETFGDLFGDMEEE